MPADHPTAVEIERFLLNLPGTPPAASPDRPGRRREIALHLLSGCALCSGRLRTMGWDDERLDRLLIVPSSQPEAEAAEPGREGKPTGKRRQTRGRRRYNYDRAFARAADALSKLLARDPARDPPARGIENDTKMT